MVNTKGKQKCTKKNSSTATGLDRAPNPVTYGNRLIL